MSYDPIEDDPKYKEIFEQVRIEAEKQLEQEGIKKCLGYCHAHWNTMKKILKEKHNIEWKTPAEMNPEIMFD